MNRILGQLFDHKISLFKGNCYVQRYIWQNDKTNTTPHAGQSKTGQAGWVPACAILFPWINNSMDIDVTAVFTAKVWFLTLLEVLNPTNSIHALIEPSVVGKIKCVSWIVLWHLHIFYVCRSIENNYWLKFSGRQYWILLQSIFKQHQILHFPLVYSLFTTKFHLKNLKWNRKQLIELKLLA